MPTGARTVNDFTPLEKYFALTSVVINRLLLQGMTLQEIARTERPTLAKYLDPASRFYVDPAKLGQSDTDDDINDEPQVTASASQPAPQPAPPAPQPAPPAPQPAPPAPQPAPKPKPKSIVLPPLPTPMHMHLGKAPWNLTKTNTAKSALKIKTDGAVMALTYPARCQTKDGGCRCGNLVGLLAELSPIGFPCTHARVSVDVKFPKDFDFVRSGKVFPGLWCGPRGLHSAGVGGGDRASNAGSVRAMWTAPGAAGNPGGKPALFAYWYNPTQVTKGDESAEALRASQGPGVRAVHRRSGKGGSAGDTLWERVDQVFTAPGEWITLSLEVRMNDIGKKNGVIGMRVNGVERRVTDVVWRTSPDIVIRGLKLASWFGGSDASVYGSSKPQTASFRNLSYEIL